MDVGELIFQQIFRHVDICDINIPICFPPLIIGFLLAQHPKVITDDEMMGPAPKSLTLNYKIFQGSHVSNLSATFQPPRRGSSSSGADL